MRLKRILMPILVVLFTMSYACAQNFVVKNLNWWHPGYPTVVNVGNVLMLSDKWSNRYSTPSEFVCKETRTIKGMEDFAVSSAAFNIDLMWTLTAIDGIDYKQLSNEQKSAAFANPVAHEWSWLTPNGNQSTKGFGFNEPLFIQTLKVDFDSDNKQMNCEQYNQKEIGYDVLIDWDVDWAKKRTYDFILAGSDPLADKKILESFAKGLEPFMSRSTDSPDVFITIAKDNESSVSYSYIPPKVEYIKTGSTTKKVYNWVGQNPRYQTEDHYQRVESQGYTKEVNHSEIYLEICMLDASKLNQETPPIIYKASLRKNFPSKINVLDEYIFYAKKFNHPVYHKHTIQKLNFDETIPYALRWGIASEDNPNHFNNLFTKDSSAKVALIYRPSLRYVRGDIPSPGDIIINRKYKNHRVHSGEEWEDIEYTYKTTDGKRKKITILSVTERHNGWLKVDPYMKGDYWFRPYLLTIEE